MTPQPRFAMATSDAYKSVLEAFLVSGWKLETLFACPGDWMNDNKQVINRALELGANVQQSPINSNNLAELAKCGCTTLVVASYQWKIPEWQAYLQHAINFHPSPLPEGRGPYPLVRAILEQHQHWAVTCHQINGKFDQGNMLAAEIFQLNPDEYHETLRLKTQMAAAKLAKRVANDLDMLWQKATPQSDGSYWPLWSEQERTIDFNRPVASIMRQIRAFGDLECIATINNVTIFIHSAQGWLDPHTTQPGTVVYSNGLALVITAADGVIAITEWSFNAPSAITSSKRR
jgi:methionyl-tRNA formyltransferase